MVGMSPVMQKYIYIYGIHKQKHKQKLQTISAVGLQYGNLSPE